MANNDELTNALLAIGAVGLGLAGGTAHVPSAQYQSGPMFCPNCGKKLERPPASSDAPTLSSKPV